MPKKSKKNELLDIVVANFMMRYLNAEDDEEEDALYSECIEELEQVLMRRYAVDFIHGSVEKSTAWLSQVVPQMDEGRFKQMFRVNRFQFDVILNEIKLDSVFTPKLQFPVESQLLITLYRLGSYGEGASVAKIANLFGIGDGGTVDIVTRRVFRALMNVKNKFIYWPDAQERRSMVAATYHELPYCVGYVDGTEFALAEKPSVSPDDYYSRKQRFSVKGQVVCDHKTRVRSIVVGHAGCVHDARIFSMSELGRNPSKYLSDPEWIAGDSAYRLTTTVITPFKRHAGSFITERQTHFNRRFSKFRVRVEHTFGIMKERFSSLKELRIRVINARGMEFLCEWVTVCAILHNIIIQHNSASDEYDEHMSSVVDVLDEGGREEGEVEESADNNSEGAMKREALVNLLF